MTIYMFMAFVKLQCHYGNPNYSYTYKENCTIWYTNCGVKSGGHVDAATSENCKIRAELVDFNTQSWPESER